MKPGLRNSGLRRRRFEEEINPLEGVVNIVDAMLVFACGLMLSLVIFWNVDLEDNRLTKVERGEKVTQIQDVRDKLAEDSSGSDAYERLGTVYRDPATGELYMLEEE